ncbi:MAG TPA: MASE1 domain-containing protein [Verrucomicrobiae bacterium]|nr:MASE1 domain-containing protein [Verrucomicrobiae bacterium]
MNGNVSSLLTPVHSDASPRETAERRSFAMVRRRHPYLFTSLGILLVGIAYFASGRFGLSLAFLNASASAVWPPTGLALAALLLFGYGLWPGIFCGAFFVNLLTQGSALTSFAIASGNTLEALLAAWLINRFVNGCRSFDRTANVFKFAFLAATLSTFVSATVGVTSLHFAGSVKPGEFWPVWTTWWIGDLVSNLIVAPLLLICFGSRVERPPSWRNLVEAAALLLAVVIIGKLVFFLEIPFGPRNEPLEYLAIPPLVWAALRFGQFGAITSAAAMSAIAIWGTLGNFGPFAGPDPNKSLLLLQAFMGTITLTALALAAVTSERKRAEQRLHVQDAVSRILLEAPGLRDATPKILQAFCEVGGWEFGAIWHFDPDGSELRCLDTWSAPSLRTSEFQTITRKQAFAQGIGLPGTVWRTGKPLWIPNVTRISNFPRAPYAAREGLRAAFGFPFKSGDNILGVIECFSPEVRQPDENFLRMLDSIGSQLGQFVERKRAEEAYRASAERLNLALAAADLGDWSWDADSDLVMFSPRAAEIFGIPPGPHMTWTKMQTLLHDEDRERARKEVERSIATQGRYDIEYRLNRADGTQVWVAALGRARYDSTGRPIGMFGVVEDITARKRLEQALRDSEQRFRGLMEQAPFSVQLFAPDGRTTAVNRAWEDLWGVNLQQIGDYNVLKDSQLDATGISAYVRRAFDGHPVEIPPIEYDPNKTLPDRTRHKDARRWVAAVAYPLKNPDGAVREVVLIHQDITARKRAEEMLASEARHLESLVQERTAKLHETIAELESYSYSVSHDMRSPLRAMQAYAEVLQKEYAAGLDAAGRHYVNRIASSADRLDRLITDVLAISRLNRAEIDLENVSLDRLVEDIIQHYPALHEANIEVAKNLGEVLAAETLLSQAIANLLTNAVKFVRPGAKPFVRIWSEKLVSAADAQSDTAEKQVLPAAIRLNIQDNGIGIALKDHQRIFDIFSRVHSEKEYEGSGIGLSIVKKAIERIGGSVGLQSALGEGSTFWIDLPAAN